MSAWWTTAFVALWLVVMIVAVILLGFLRRVTAVLERAELAVSSGQVSLGGARVGMHVDKFDAVDASGGHVPPDGLFTSAAIYVLLHSGCEPCRHLVDRIRTLRPSKIPVVAVLDDTPAGREFQLPPHVEVLFEHDGSVAAAFKSGGTPQAFAVAEGGVLVDFIVPASVADLEHLARTLEKGGDNAPITSEVSHVA